MGMIWKMMIVKKITNQNPTKIQNLKEVKQVQEGIQKRKRKNEIKKNSFH